MDDLEDNFDDTDDTQPMDDNHGEAGSEKHKDEAIYPERLRTSVREQHTIHGELNMIKSNKPRRSMRAASRAATTAIARDLMSSSVDSPPSKAWSLRGNRNHPTSRNYRTDTICSENRQELDNSRKRSSDFLRKSGRLTKRRIFSEISDESERADSSAEHPESETSSDGDDIIPARESTAADDQDSLVPEIKTLIKERFDAPIPLPSTVQKKEAISYHQRERLQFIMDHNFHKQAASTIGRSAGDLGKRSRRAKRPRVKHRGMRMRIDGASLWIDDPFDDAEIASAKSRIACARSLMDISLEGWEAKADAERCLRSQGLRLAPRRPTMRKVVWEEADDSNDDSNMEDEINIAYAEVKIIEKEKDERKAFNAKWRRESVVSVQDTANEPPAFAIQRAILPWTKATRITRFQTAKKAGESLSLQKSHIHRRAIVLMKLRDVSMVQEKKQMEAKVTDRVNELAKTSIELDERIQGWEQIAGELRVAQLRVRSA